MNLFSFPFVPWGDCFAHSILQGFFQRYLMVREDQGFSSGLRLGLVFYDGILWILDTIQPPTCTLFCPFEVDMGYSCDDLCMHTAMILCPPTARVNDDLVRSLQGAKLGRGSG